ncbi:MAG: hypothetical protein AOY29_11400 [Alcanivorax borkumensis]|nr:MAG: hypothetical protein AOY29_11400 [Alcanivorax borkumensis]
MTNSISAKFINCAGYIFNSSGFTRMNGHFKFIFIFCMQKEGASFNWRFNIFISRQIKPNNSAWPT